MYVKYAGLTAAAAEVLERHRSSPSESESDIIVRTLGKPDGNPISPKRAPRDASESNQLDVGQGIFLNVGETAYLFLSKSDMLQNRTAATAVVTNKGLRLDGRIFPKYHGSYVQQPMKEVQKRLKHVNELGELISLNAYTKWHVVRDRALVAIGSLKDESKSRKRSRTRGRDLLAELGID